MYKIVKKESLNPTVTLMEVEAPLVSLSSSERPRMESVFRLLSQDTTERREQ